jgi:hypothetical protein
MKCAQAKLLFSPYLDGAMTGKQMHAFSDHVEACGSCRSEYLALQRTQQLVANLGRRKAPADLELNLRLAVSREAARTSAASLTSLWLRIEYALKAFMVPVSAGLATAMLIFAVLMGFSAMPLQADDSDVPLMLHTAPRLEPSIFPTASLDSITDDALVIEAYVDANGRVQDYRILSDSETSKRLLPQVKNMLIFTTFRPATSMGRPTTGRAVLSFSKISVRG